MKKLDGYADRLLFEELHEPSRNGIHHTRKPVVADDTLRPPVGRLRSSKHYKDDVDIVLYHGLCEKFLDEIPPASVQLVVTSPPYNIGKEYEKRRTVDDYLSSQKIVISKAVRTLKDGGSVCWQVGNHVENGRILPLDIVLYPLFVDQGLTLRNRIVWHFEHGLHASKRFSGRYETILWFTKGDKYCFNLDEVRVPQKYPNKRAFKGPNIGQLTCNPRGKNPGDVWIFPNVKWNHVEKTIHPCQFPIELVERLVLALSLPGDAVLDPYGGVGSTALAAILNQRRGLISEIRGDYLDIAKERIQLAEEGRIRVRPRSRPIYQPT